MQNIELGSRIRQIRTSMNISMEQLATMAKVDLIEMSEIEKGNIQPNDQYFQQIGKALNCPVSLIKKV